MLNRDVPAHASLLLIHDDSDLLDALTRVFEARGFEVAIAATGFAVASQLSAEREFQAIIAGWDSAQKLGAAAYRWVLDNRYELRTRFVFLAKEPPYDFDDIVQGRCLLLNAYDFDEIVQVTEAMARRELQRAGAELSGDAVDWVDEGKPSLLLVEDEPMQLSIMKSLLAESGFAVTAVESGKAAVAQLEASDFDVILCDWFMASGSGGAIYEWVLRQRPHLATRCVFMSATRPTPELVKQAPGRPFVPKGQDSETLVSHLRSIAQRAGERSDQDQAVA